MSGLTPVGPVSGVEDQADSRLARWQWGGVVVGVGWGGGGGWADQLGVPPIRTPTPKVTAAATPPTTSWRSPDRSGERPLSSAHPAPTASIPATASHHGRQDAARPPVTRYGQHHENGTDREGQHARQRGPPRGT